MRQPLFVLYNETYKHIAISFKEHLATKGYSQSVVIYLHSYILEFFQRLETSFAINNLHQVDTMVIQKYYNYLETRLKFRGSGGLSASMLKGHMYGLRLLFSWLVKINMLEVNPMSGGFDISAMTVPYRIGLSEDQVKILFSACITPIESALLSLLYSGLRRSEASNLNCNNILWNEGFIVVENGKFHKRREVPAVPKVLALLSAYYHQREEVLNRQNEDSRKAFLLNLEGNRLTGNLCYVLFKEILARTSLPKNVCPHVMRHSFALALKLRGAPIEFISEILGHSSIDVTAHYLRFQELNMVKPKKLFYGN